MNRCAFGIVAIVLSLQLLAKAADPKTDLHFDFGSGKPGFTQVSPTTAYSKEAGFGFEAGAEVKAGGNCCASNQPFLFSAAVPAGNYKVTVTLGDGNVASTTTVKAELRRLMLEKVHTDAGKSETRVFTVNVRTPDIAGGEEVHLKPREKTSEMMAWDDKLTLEFNGDHHERFITGNQQSR